MSLHPKTLALIASSDQVAAELYDDLAEMANNANLSMLVALIDLTLAGDVIADDPAAVAEMPHGKRMAIQALLLLGLGDFVRRYDAELTAMREGAQ